MHSNTSVKISLLGTIIWAVGAIFFLYEFFLRTFLGALAQQIIPAIKLSPSQFALLASIFYVAYGLMQVPAAAITDKVGVKLTLFFASLLCAVSALGFSQTHAFYSALLFRFGMGLGGGFAFICLLVVTMEWFPKRYLALFIGIGQFTGTMGALIAGGPLANVVVKHHIPWRIIFIAIGCFGGLIAILSLLFVKDKKTGNSQKIIVLKRKESLTKKLKSLLTTKQALWIACYSAFVFLSVAMLGAVWGTVYLQSLGFAQQTAAMIISFAWLGFACGCPLLGYISDSFNCRKPTMLFCSTLGVFLSIWFVYIPMHTVWIYCALLFLLGITSAGQSIGFAIITEHVRPELKSMALGINSAFITLLAAIVPYLVSLVIEAVSHTAKTKVIHYHHSNFYIAFAIIPLLYLLSLAVVLFFIQETYCRPQQEVIKLSRKKMQA